MPDKYIPRKDGSGTRKWTLNHVWDDPDKEDGCDFSFDKILGEFRTEADAVECARLIEADTDWNFAKWFWPRYFYDNTALISQAELGDRARLMWWNLGSSLEEKAIRMAQIMALYVRACESHEQIVDDMNARFAEELAGEDW